MSHLSQVWRRLKNYMRNPWLQKIPKTTDLATEVFLPLGKISQASEKGVKFSQDNSQPGLSPQRLRKSLEELTKSKFNLGEPQLHAEIYDVLGNDALTSEIVEQVMNLFINDQKFRPVLLFQCLEDFYSRWCRGEFIDAAPSNNLPQKKMMAMTAQNMNVGLRQVDICTGLNVLILLLELHRYAQEQEHLGHEINFYPSTEPDTDNFFTSQLLRVINYSDAIEIGNFSSVVGEFLRGGNFKGAYLGDANLTGVNFSGANLSGAYLGDANLTGANLNNTNLTGANLGDANLSSANLSDANLSSADLSSANLSGVNLSGANLYRADLSHADFNSANLSNADFNHANLTSANLRDANLSSANLSHAILFGTNLSDANLSGVNLSHADLCRADLSGADLRHAILDGTNLSDTILFSTNLSQAVLIAADLSYAKLNGAKLNDARLNGAMFLGADLSGVDLTGVILNDADLTGVILNGADLSDANLEEMTWSEKHQWEGVRGLETALNVPEALKQQLGLR